MKFILRGGPLDGQMKEIKNGRNLISWNEETVITDGSTGTTRVVEGPRYVRCLKKEGKYNVLQYDGE